MRRFELPDGSSVEIVWHWAEEDPWDDPTTSRPDSRYSGVLLCTKIGERFIAAFADGQKISTTAGNKGVTISRRKVDSLDTLVTKTGGTVMKHVAEQKKSLGPSSLRYVREIEALAPGAEYCIPAETLSGTICYIDDELSARGFSGGFRRDDSGNYIYFRALAPDDL